MLGVWCARRHVRCDPQRVQERPGTMLVSSLVLGALLTHPSNSLSDLLVPRKFPILDADDGFENGSDGEE